MPMRILLALLITLTLGGCATVHTTDSGVVGVQRTQRMSYSAAEVNNAAVQAYGQTLQKAQSKGILNRNSAQLNRVRTIANRLIPATAAFRKDGPGWQWEVNVISSDEVNAWCMPGGKMAVYTGLIEKLQVTDDELAAVMGHEIAHALREHGREKASQQQAQAAAVNIGAALLGLGNVATNLAGVVANVTWGLPNSREFEHEADNVGVELAARAGYDPRAAITLWQKMERAAGGGGPGFLSTHPSAANRISELQKAAARVMPLYQQTSGQMK